MNAVVRFRTRTGEWAVDVASTRRVLPAGQLTPLPAPLPDVAGVLRPPGDSAALPVLTALGGVAGSGQVLELEAGGRRFGLLVDEVVGVLRDIHAARGPAPEGQEAELVCGTLLLEDCSVLLLDGEALARRLEPAGPRVTRRD